MNKTVAIFSPNKNSYSETFIQAQKKIAFNVRFYYDGHLPSQLEGKGAIISYSKKNRIQQRFNKFLTIPEKCLAESLRKENVGCVLAQYGPTACETLKVLKYLRLPLIVHFHGYDASNEHVLKSYHQQYIEVFQYADAIICVSKTMLDTLVRLGCPSEKIHLMACGPDPAFLSLKPKYQKSKFLAVGRFVDKKAPQLTVMAFKEVVKAFPDAELVMVGEGELLNSCKSLCAAFKINNVTFKGILHLPDILELMQDSIAFVQHSVIAANGDSEGTPVAVLEAQAAALPVISTYHAGIPDVVIHNETGLLVEEYNIEGMGVYMKRILEEKELAQKLGAAGRKRVQDFYTQEKYLKSLNALLEKTFNNMSILIAKDKISVML